jgi:cytochrome c
MSKSLKFLAPITAAAIIAAPVLAQQTLGLGRDALAEEIAAWDIDIRPDGLGLPAGSGDVWTGEEVFVEKCASCHGDFGEGRGRWPVLSGGAGTLSNDDPVKTIGSYWPYLSTVYDYIYRAMPFGEAQSLEPDEVYAITAYLLYMNDLVEDDFTLSNESFLDVEMPNAPNFYMDDRAETELPLFAGTVCMENCKASVEITMNATVLDVTPDTEEDATTETVAVEEPAADDAPAPDPVLVEAGEGAFRQCKACHQLGENATNRTGPVLNGMVGRTIGSVEGFRYSGVFQEAAEAGEVWTQESLSSFLADPRGTMSGTKMSFRGMQDAEDIDALIAYIQSFDD